MYTFQSREPQEEIAMQTRAARRAEMSDARRAQRRYAKTQIRLRKRSPQPATVVARKDTSAEAAALAESVLAAVPAKVPAPSLDVEAPTRAEPSPASYDWRAMGDDEIAAIKPASLSDDDKRARKSEMDRRRKAAAKGTTATASAV